MVVPEVVSLVDVAPTLLEAVGLPVPKEMQGKSLLPLVERKVEGWRKRSLHPNQRVNGWTGIED
jgi:arylsulfatase A-like enzyme